MASAQHRILSEIQGAGKISPAGVKQIIELLYMLQTSLHGMTEDEFRDIVEEVMEDD